MLRSVGVGSFGVHWQQAEMFEDIAKPNLTNLLVLGLVSVVLPRLLPQMSPAVGTAVKVVVDLLTESEAEAAEELMEALVSSTMDEIREAVSRAADPQQSRQTVEQTVARFKHRAHRRAHRWAADEPQGKRRYRRHVNRLREVVDESRDELVGWRRNILDDLGESLEEAV